MLHGKTLSLKEQKAIEELQRRVKNDLPASLSGDDLVFYQFLKARDFDVENAEKMLRKHIHWRKVYQMDTFLEDFKPIDVLLKYASPTVLGFDKSGDMVLYFPGGNVDTKDLLKCAKMNDVSRHLIWTNEKQKVLQQEENKKTGGHASQVTVIYDLENFTLSNATSKSTVDMLLTLLLVNQDHYPELLKALFLINCPPYYVIAFSVLKTFLSTATLHKFNVFGRCGWKEKLTEAVGEDILPAFLGGDRTDPDGNPMCNTFVLHSGRIPPSYYLSDEDRYFRDPTQVEKVIISAGKRKEIQVEVIENGSRIEWEYYVMKKDIGFGLDYHTTEGQVECILPIQKYSTSDGTETGFYKCRKLGSYVVIFDNTHSWISSKEVEYVIRTTKG